MRSVSTIKYITLFILLWNGNLGFGQDNLTASEIECLISNLFCKYRNQLKPIDSDSTTLLSKAKIGDLTLDIILNKNSIIIEFNGTNKKESVENEMKEFLKCWKSEPIKGQKKYAYNIKNMNFREIYMETFVNQKTITVLDKEDFFCKLVKTFGNIEQTNSDNDTLLKSHNSKGVNTTIVKKKTNLEFTFNIENKNRDSLLSVLNDLIPNPMLIPKCIDKSFRLLVDIDLTKEDINSLIENSRTIRLNQRQSDIFIKELINNYGANIVSPTKENPEILTEVILTNNIFLNVKFEGKNKLKLEFKNRGKSIMSKSTIMQEMRKLIGQNPMLYTCTQSSFQYHIELADSNFITKINTLLEKRTITLSPELTSQFYSRMINYFGQEMQVEKGDKVYLKTTVSKNIPSEMEILVKQVKDTLQITFKSLSNHNLDANEVNEWLYKMLGHSVSSQKSMGKEFRMHVVVQPDRKFKYVERLKFETRKTRFSVGISGGAVGVYRSLTDAKGSGVILNQIANRNQNEYSFLSGQLNVSAGVSTTGHRYSFGYSFAKFGYMFNNSGWVDSQTGLFNPSGTANKQTTNVHGFSLNYEYTHYEQEFAPYILLSTQVMFDGKKINELGSYPNRFFGTNLRAAFGLAYTPKYLCTFHLAPTGLIFLNSRKHEQINARFYNLGIELGATFHLNRGLLKHQNNKKSD